MAVRKLILLTIVVINIVILSFGIIFTPRWFWLLIIPFPLMILAFYNNYQSKHAILRNYPILGYFRFFFEIIRSQMRQYFCESDTDGRPFNFSQCYIVYQRYIN